MKCRMSRLMIMLGPNGKKTSMPVATVNTIILFDSSSDLERLKKINYTNAVIITFDYESHKLLTQKNIPHEISDKYINNSDLTAIHHAAYKFSKWYDESSITNLLQYENINLGRLFYVEFHYFLVPFLKKFVEFLKINVQYPNAKFIASPSLFKIAKEITATVDKIDPDEKLESSFLYDTVKFQLTDSITFNISRKSYFKLKKISEKIIFFFLNQKKITKQKKSILLIEFDPLRYEKLFKSSINHPINFILYNRRRPAIWNRKSYHIIKNSNCIVATYQGITNKRINEHIKKTKSSFTNQLHQIWEQEDFFQTFFSIDNISFWNIIKFFFKELCEKRILEAIQEIILIQELLQKIKISSILVWSENGFNEQIAIKIAKRSNIKVVLMQHGMYWETDENYEQNKFAGIFPEEADKMIVWGKQTKEYITRCGFHEKSEELGSSLYENIFDRKKTNLIHKTNLILLATSSPKKNEIFDLTVQTMQNYEDTIKKICQIVSKTNKKLIIKLHPFQEELDVSNIIKEIDPTISIIKNGDIVSLIEKCELLIIIDFSTTILEAQILNKPVISVFVKDRKIKQIPPVFSTNSCIITNLENLESTLNKLLFDNEYKQSIIKNAEKFVNDYITNQGNAVEKIIAFLEKYN